MLEYHWNNHSINVHRLLHDFFRCELVFFFFSLYLFKHQKLRIIPRTFDQYWSKYWSKPSTSSKVLWEEEAIEYFFFWWWSSVMEIVDLLWSRVLRREGREWICYGSGMKGFVIKEKRGKLIRMEGECFANKCVCDDDKNGRRVFVMMICIQCNALYRAREKSDTIIYQNRDTYIQITRIQNTKKIVTHTYKSEESNTHT